VVEHPFGRPGEHRADRVDTEVALVREFMQFRHQIGVPVLVDEADARRRTLLSRRGVRVVVSYGRNEVEVLLAEVGSVDFRIESCILDLDPPAHDLGEGLRGSARSCELQHPDRVGVVSDEPLHGAAVGVDEGHVVRRQPQRERKPDKFLEHDAHLAVALDDDRVAHEECPHHLEHRDLDGEVEGVNDDHRSVGEPVVVALLPRSIARAAHAVSQVPHLVTGEVLEEPAGDRHLAHALCQRFADGEVDQVREVVGDLLSAERVRELHAELAVEHVPRLVLQRVVESRLGTPLEVVGKRVELRALGFGHLAERFPANRVGDDLALGGALPGPVDVVHDGPGAHLGVAGVDHGECGKVRVRRHRDGVLSCSQTVTVGMGYQTEYRG